VDWLENLSKTAADKGWSAALEKALRRTGRGFEPHRSVEWLGGGGLLEACREAVAQDPGRLRRWQPRVVSLLSDLKGSWHAGRAAAVFAAANAAGANAGWSAGKQRLVREALALWNCPEGPRDAAAELAPGAADLESLLLAAKSSDPAWLVSPVRDLLALFATGAWETPGRSVRVTVPFASDVGGLLVGLRLTLVADGHGELYPDAAGLAFTQFDRDFAKSMRVAWDTYAARWRERQAPVSVRFSLEPFRSEPASWHGSTLCGTSAGAGFGVALLCLFEKLEHVDPDFAVTGALADADGRLGPVSRIRLKTLPLAIYPTLRLLLPAGNREPVPPDWRERTDEARTVAEAWQIASGLRREVIAYLETVVDQAERLPDYYGGARLEGVRVRVRVAPLRRKTPREARARETKGRPVADRERDQAYRHRLAHLLDPEDGDGSANVLDWERDVRGRLRRGVLIGDPGIGKTWVLKCEAAHTARAALRELHDGARLDEVSIVVRLRLTDVAEELLSLPRRRRSLSEAIISGLRPLRSSSDARVGPAAVSERLCDLFRARFRSGDRVLVLLDALDEVPDDKRGSLLDALREHCRSNPGTRVILSSRAANYERPWDIAGLSDAEREIELMPFDRGQTEEFISRFFAGEEERARRLTTLIAGSHQLRGLGSIPLLLSLLCALFRDDEADLDWPRLRRAGVYEAVIRRFLKGVWHDERAGRIRGADLEAELEELAAVSLQLFAEGREQFSESRLREAIGEQLGRLRSSGITRRVSAWVGRGILVPAGADEHPALLYLHLTFQEYLAARALAAEAGRTSFESWFENRLIPHLYDPRWREVLTLLVDTLAEELAFSYLEALRRHGADDLLARPLEIACLAAAQLPPDLAHREARWVSELAVHAVALYVDGGPWLTRGLETGVVALWRYTLPLLLRKLEDPAPDVRENAAAAVQRISDPAALPALLPLLQAQSDEVRLAAIAALISIDDPSVLPALLPLLEVRNPRVRTAAATSLAQLPPHAGLAGMRTLLKSKNGAIRRQIVDMLKDVDDLDTFYRLLPLATDEDPELTGAFLNARTRIGRAFFSRTTPWLVPLARDYADDGPYAVLGRVRLGDPASRPALLPLLEHDDPEVRSLARIAFCGIHGPGGVPALSSMLSDDNADVRTEAVAALGRSGDRASLPAIIQLLKDPAHEVRSAAAHAVGMIRDPAEGSSLLLLLDDPCGDVRGSAAVALGRLGIRAALQDLLALLRDDDEEVRSQAVAALGYLGDPAALRAIFTRLGDKDEFVRSAAAEALGDIGAPAAVNELSWCLVDESKPVRIAAARALLRIRGPEALPSLLHLLRDEDTRDAVARALVDESVGIKVPSLKLGVDHALVPMTPEYVSALRWLGVAVPAAAPRIGFGPEKPSRP